MSIHNLGIAKYRFPPEQIITSTDLNDKTILVVGANSGFGLRIIEELRNSNAKVLTTVNSEIKMSSDYRLNLMSKESITKLGHSILEAGIKLDGVVNCAGVAENPVKLMTATDIDFEQVIAINLTSVYYLVKALQPHLKINSMFVQLAGGGASGPMKYLPAYSASKAGVVRLIETLAEELKDLYININCLGPGPLKSSMTTNLLSSPDAEVRTAMAGLIPGKFGYINPEHTAKCVSLMFSGLFANTTGKFFSSQWDDWSNIEQLINAANCSSSSYTLRRVFCLDE